MAEAVQQKLEDQVEELHDLRQRGLFSKSEIAEIVKRRRAFEYALRRRTSRKVDYLKYIEYERNVDALRVRRKSTRQRRDLNGVADHTIIRRVMNLYRKALEKFKGDLELWLSYFDYCEEQRSYKQLNRVMANCLQFHSNVPAIWIRAAKLEFEVNKNIGAARVFLQRGLRINRESPELWVEYLRLELLHWEMMSRRAAILGVAKDEDNLNGQVVEGQHLARDAELLDVPDLNQEEEVEEVQLVHDDERAEALDMLRAVTTDADSHSSMTVTDAATPGSMQHEITERAKAYGGDSFLSGLVPRLVCLSALRAQNYGPDLAQDLLNVFVLFRDTAQSRNMVYNLLSERLKAGHTTDVVGTLSVLANRSLTESRAPDIAAPTHQEQAALHGKALTYLTQHRDQVPEHSPQALLAAIRFLRHQLETQAKEHRETLMAHVTTTTAALRATLAATDAEGTPSKKKRRATTAPAWPLEQACNLVQGACALAETLVFLEQASQAYTLAQDALSFAHSLPTTKRAKTELSTDWSDSLDKLVLLSLQLQVLVAPTVPDVSAFDRARALASREVQAQIWDLELSQRLADQDDAAVASVYRRALLQLDILKPAERAVLASRALNVVAWQSIAEARQLFDWIFKETGLAEWSFIRTMVGLESSLPHVDTERMVKLFELAVRHFGNSNTDVWVAYIQWKLAGGDGADASQLHFRAVKALDDPAEFIARARGALNGHA